MIKTFDSLGLFFRKFKKFYIKKKYLNESDQLFINFYKIIQKCIRLNPWFSMEDLITNFDYWGKILNKNNIFNWINQYNFIQKKNSKKTVLVIMPGNIPMAGFHDFLCVILIGYNIIIKLSEKDNVLIPFICKIITDKNPFLKKKIFFSKNFLKEKYDYVIASGGNNTFRYFQYYFKKIPSILRKSKTSISVLKGTENNYDLFNLNKDIFLYSGRGCKNIGKIFIPVNYNIKLILKKSLKFKYLIHNKKYMNNYKFYKNLFKMNEYHFFYNKILIFRESKKIYSPISVVYYEYYKNLSEVKNFISKNNHLIQCIVSKNFIKGEKMFGKVQFPRIDEFPDEIDTIKFLIS